MMLFQGMWCFGKIGRSISRKLDNPFEQNLEEEGWRRLLKECLPQHLHMLWKSTKMRRKKRQRLLKTYGLMRCVDNGSGQSHKHYSMSSKRLYWRDHWIDGSSWFIISLYIYGQGSSKWGSCGGQMQERRGDTKDIKNKYTGKHKKWWRACVKINSCAKSTNGRCTKR